MAEKKKKKEKDKRKDTQTVLKDQKQRRAVRWTSLGVALALLGTCFLLAHSVRGTLVTKPSDKAYAQAVRRTAFGAVRIRSQEDMDDLGAIAYRAVAKGELTPGPFYVHYLPRLDVREKLHHLLHSPFTGLRSIYTDVWINSCTTYGAKESTWAFGKAEVYPADKLSILIILIDRLKREKSGIGEHLGAYLEVVGGMELHTVKGRASCYLLLVNQCARDRELTSFVQKQLKRRTSAKVDQSESEFWRCIVQSPTYDTLTDLAAGTTCPEAPPAEKRPTPSAAFMSVLSSRVEQLRPKKVEEPPPERREREERLR
jgi:hypothetical protein